MDDQYVSRRRVNGTAAAAGKADPTLGRAHSGRTRQQPRREWWHPTPTSRIVGALLVTILLLVVMAVVGAIEGAPPARGDSPSRYEREVALWDGLTPLDRAYYCELPRRDAVLVWAAGMDEGEFTNGNMRIARRVLSRGCPT